MAPQFLAEAVTPEPAPVVAPFDNGNGDLRAALDDVWAELKALRLAVELHQQPLPAASDRKPAADRLAEAVDRLPDRIRTTVHDALTRLSGEDSPPPDPDRP